MTTMHNEYKMNAVPGAEEPRMLLWEAMRLLQRGLDVSSEEVSRVMSVTHSLAQMLEHTRVQYNNALAERDVVYRRLKNVDAQLQQVENIVRRYALVQDPVIASDGYTYERTAITDYLKECAQTNSKAYSQQTKEELSNVVVANLSLSRLVDLLKGIRTAELPPLKPHSAIVCGGGGGGARSATASATGNAMMSSTAAMSSVEQANAAAAAAAAMAAGGKLTNASNATTNVAATAATPGAAAASGVAAAAATRRFDHTQSRYGGKPTATAGTAAAAAHLMGGAKPDLHPCLRVYGCCNFMDDCTFANYPFEACLNFIKGKCRFGVNCKELHVDVRDPAYQNLRSSALTNTHARYPHATTATATTSVAATTSTLTTAATATATTTASTATPAMTAAAPEAQSHGDESKRQGSVSGADEQQQQHNNNKKSSISSSGSHTSTPTSRHTTQADTTSSADATRETTSLSKDDTTDSTEKQHGAAVAAAATTTVVMLRDASREDDDAATVTAAAHSNHVNVHGDGADEGVTSAVTEAAANATTTVS